MRQFAVSMLRRNTVRDLFRSRHELDLSPSYQRQSDLWQLPKRQLFLDSIINGFDVPKLYFHKLPWKPTSKSGHEYAIVDGKQRLETVWDYLDGDFPLSDDFEFLDDPKVAAAGMKYAQLVATYPQLAARIDAFELPVVVLETADLELIEEMFSRLNEAVPLNAPEKRNAFGGPLPTLIRKLAMDEFFRTRVPFPNNRYRHLDLATKFLYIEHRRTFVDLKKRQLDEFVLEFKRDNRKQEADSLCGKASKVLGLMGGVFTHQDSLLSSVGLLVVYYHIFRDVQAGVLSAGKFSRETFVRFEHAREQNRALAREAEERGRQNKRAPRGTPQVNAALLKFDQLMQSPNDASALRYRYEAISEFSRKV